MGFLFSLFLFVCCCFGFFCVCGVLFWVGKGGIFFEKGSIA